MLGAFGRPCIVEEAGCSGGGVDRIIDFIRHGEPVGGQRYRGSGVDDPLSERGWEQMWRAVPAPPPWDAVVSSPMKRCFPFADAVATREGLPLRVEERFREIGFGDWEGFTADEIRSRDQPAYEAFYRDPANCRPAGAESLEGFCRRVSSGFDELLETPGTPHLLVVAHAGVIRAALRHVMGWPMEAWYRVRVDNGALTRFRTGAQGLQLQFHNLLREG